MKLDTVTRRAANGFSLVELLVVLAIIALAAALVIPTVGSGQSNRMVKQSADAIAGVLQESRLRSLARNEEVSVDFNTTTRVFSASGADFQVPENIEIKLLSAKGNALDADPKFTFFPDGSSTGGSITLSDDRKSSRVAIHWLTGRIAVTDNEQQ